MLFQVTEANTSRKGHAFRAQNLPFIILHVCLSFTHGIIWNTFVPCFAWLQLFNVRMVLTLSVQFSSVENNNSYQTG